MNSQFHDDYLQPIETLKLKTMNKSVIIKLFAGMFPAADQLTFDFVDGKVILKVADESIESELDVDGTKSNVSLLKDFLNIKGAINKLHIDFNTEKVEVTHTNGVKQL